MNIESNIFRYRIENKVKRKSIFNSQRAGQGQKNVDFPLE
jgi:hypothetical protein